jgi:hypothetical protein
MVGNMIEMMRRVPILMPIYLIACGIFSLFVRAPQWLLGFWWCDDCHCKFSYKYDKKEEIAYGHDGAYLLATRCEKCECKRTSKNDNTTG